jgi:hypothetical protein
MSAPVLVPPVELFVPPVELVVPPVELLAVPPVLAATPPVVVLGPTGSFEPEQAAIPSHPAPITVSAEI